MFLIEISKIQIPLPNCIIELLKGKLHFTTINYVLDYTLYHKLFDCTLWRDSGAEAIFELGI